MKPYQNLSLVDMPGEIWKDIPGWESYYQVSNLGRVKSLSRRSESGKLLRTKILRQPAVTKGYLHVRLYKNGKITALNPSRLVAIAFIPNPDNKPQIDHIDADKTNNTVSNLRWTTARENQNNPILLKRRRENFYRPGFKEAFIKPRYGLNNNKTRSIIAINPITNETKYYVTMSDCAKDGFTPSNVSKVCRKLMHHSGGWKFFYANDPDAKSYLPREHQFPSQCSLP